MAKICRSDAFAAKCDICIVRSIRHSQRAFNVRVLYSILHCVYASLESIHHLASHQELPHYFDVMKLYAEEVDPLYGPSNVPADY